MAGHMIYLYLDKQKKYDLTNIVHKNKLNDESIVVDVTNEELFTETIREITPDIIINGIGVLLKGSASDPANAIYLNAYLPNYLSKILKKSAGRMIHLSTDCVFSGKIGSYKETDFKDADDLYGRAKSLGEVINDRDMTFRTSIIGPEVKENGEGLLNWFFNQKAEINGYEKAIWSGVTTLQIAKGIEQAIDNDITGLYHYTNGKKINKFDLLSLTNQIFNKDIKINKVEGKDVDKSLVDNRKEPSLSVPNYEEMLKELQDFMIENKSYYQHYDLKL